MINIFNMNRNTGHFSKGKFDVGTVPADVRVAPDGHPAGQDVYMECSRRMSCRSEDILGILSVDSLPVRVCERSALSVYPAGQSMRAERSDRLTGALHTITVPLKMAFRNAPKDHQKRSGQFPELFNNLK
jgi:hypothetical protein